MAASVDGIQDPYLTTLDLYTSEQLNLYKMDIFGLPESDRYDHTRSKWTNFYQELEAFVSTFGSKSAVFIVTSRDAGYATTEVKNIILSYPSITKIMVGSYCEIMWADNSREIFGCHPTANYSAGLDDAQKQ